MSGLIDALAERNVAAGLTLIQQLMTEGASLTEFCHQVIEHLRSVMVLQMTGEQSFLAELPADTIVQMQRQAQQLALATTLFAIKRFSTATVELKNSHQPQLPLELALIESIQGEVTAVANMGTVGIQAAVPVATVAPVASAPASPVAAAVSPSTAAGEADGANAAPAEAAEPAPLDEAAVKRLHSQWDNFKRMVRDKSGVRVQAALTAVRDIAVGDQTVAFAFGINQFSRDMIAEPEIMGQVVGLLSSVLGRSVKLDCQMGEKAKANQYGSSAPRAAGWRRSVGGICGLYPPGAEVVD
ncbi:MAG: hypothetical protein R2867_04985 [Caldilineaceae bacterium]